LIKKFPSVSEKMSGGIFLTHTVYASHKTWII